MTNEQDPFRPPSAAVVDKTDDSVAQRKPKAIWMLVTILIVAINLFLKYAYAVDIYNSSTEGIIGYVIGGAIGPPLFLVALFQLGQGFRNNDSRLKIFFWMSVLGVLTTLNGLRG